MPGVWDVNVAPAGEPHRAESCCAAVPTPRSQLEALPRDHLLRDLIGVKEVFHLRFSDLQRQMS